MSDLTPDEIDRIYDRIEKQMRQRFDTRAEYYSHMAAFVVAIVAGLWMYGQSWMPGWVVYIFMLMPVLSLDAQAQRLWLAPRGRSRT